MAPKKNATSEKIIFTSSDLKVLSTSPHIVLNKYGRCFRGTLLNFSMYSSLFVKFALTTLSSVSWKN